ncbi:type IV pilus assembly protein PilC [Caloramator fervidus]|uniref:Type IV pilus assembly protein PilC n=1 Tax=Caloramator fervidus TaxID=29344 RepID=A0A1H5V2A2_9CLOT|nr:type II secretion system F family protein [Caloramator fervidus]SEF81592.1 type IV pilus assembly protein PilC [Caloramator fervidus]
MLPLKIDLNKRILKGGSVSLYRLNKKEIAKFFSYIYFITSSGINFIKGVNILKDMTNNKKLNVFINELFDLVAAGNSFSDSIERVGIFPSLAVALIRVGEKSGRLEDVFLELSNYYENEYEFERKIMRSLYYPLFLTSTALISILLITNYIIPKIIRLLKEFNITQIPKLTLFILDFSKCFSKLILFFSFLFFILVFMYKFSKNGIKRKIDFILLYIPIYKSLKMDILMSRLGKCLHLMIISGVPIVECLNLAASLIDNVIVYEEYMNALNEIMLGKGISEAFRKRKIFPNYFVEFISIGEETGELDDALIKISDFLNKEVTIRLNSLITLIEPFIIIIISLFVFITMLSILFPIFQIYEKIGL